jgi:predicted nucleic acid-binding protein
MTVVDTTVWIDLFAARDTPQVRLLERLITDRTDICVCGVVLTEVLQGIRNPREYAKTLKILEGLLYLPMERSTFLLAAQVFRTLRARGLTIRNTVDCMIAAVCLENRAALLHNDRDFGLISTYFPLKVLETLPR